MPTENPQFFTEIIHDRCREYQCNQCIRIITTLRDYFSGSGNQCERNKIDTFPLGVSDKKRITSEMWKRKLVLVFFMENVTAMNRNPCIRKAFRWVELGCRNIHFPARLWSPTLMVVKKKRLLVFCIWVSENYGVSWEVFIQEWWIREMCWRG